MVIAKKPKPEGEFTSQLANQEQIQDILSSPGIFINAFILGSTGNLYRLSLLERLQGPDGVVLGIQHRFSMVLEKRDALALKLLLTDALCKDGVKKEGS